MKTHTPQKLFVTLSALLALVLANEAQAMNKYRSNGTGGGNWNATATWQLSTDGGGTWGTASATPTSADDTIEIRSPDTVTVTAAVSVDQVTVDAGGKITISSGITLTIANGTGTDLDVFGTLQNSGTSGSQITINSGATIAFESGGTYIHDFSNGGTIPTATWDVNSTCKVISQTTGSAPSGLGQSFGNFTWNCPSQGASIGLAGALTTINGTFTVNGTGSAAQELRLASTQVYSFVVKGDLVLQAGIFSGASSSMSGGTTWTIGGNWNQSGGNINANSGSSSIDVTFSSAYGTAASSFTLSSGNFPGSNNKYNFIVGSGKTLTLNNNLPTGSSNSRSNIINGTLLCNGFNVTGSALFFLNAGATLGITDANGITSSGASGNIQVTGTRAYSSSANYIYGGSASSAVTGNGLSSTTPTANTVNNLTINNANGVTLSGNVQVNSGMTMTAGALALGGNTLSYGSSGTLQYNGSSSQTTAAAEFPSSSGPASLTVNNGSGVTLNFARTITGTLTLTSGKLTTSGANLLTLGGAASISGGSSSSYVNGPLAQVYTGTGSKIFPIGVSPNFRQVALNLTGISGTPTMTVTPNEPSAWNGANTPANTTMWGTRDWTVNSSASGNTATLTVDGTAFTPTGAARIDGCDGTSTTAYTPTFVSPNYTASSIILASGNNEFALGDFACSAPPIPSAPSANATCGNPGPVSVSWSTVSGAASYNVYRKLSGGTYGAALAIGQTGTSYSDTSAAYGNTYVYAVTSVSGCGAESALSSDSGSATVLKQPGITSSPVNYAFYDGFSVQPAFTVVATGSGLTYQWQVNKSGAWGNAVEGTDGTGSQTSTFTTASTVNSMSGYQYRCVVSGTCSPSATSAVATLSLGTQFRSLATGIWTDNASWQLSADGLNWNSVPTGVYPNASSGHSDSVSIGAHNATCAANASAGSVSLTSASSVLTIPDAVTLTVAGNVSTVASSAISYSGTGQTGTLSIGGNFSDAGILTQPGGGGGKIIFNGTTQSWTTGGDISGAKVSVTVSAGSTLTLQADVKLRNNTTQAGVTINGTLKAGTYKFSGQTSGSSASGFTMGAGATLETANAGGIGGVGTTGTWQGYSGAAVTIANTCNFIFDGAANQSAGSMFPATVNNLTINNTGGVGANTVTLGTTTISGVLYIQSGLLSFGGTTTSTAGLLTFDNSTYQAVGTWGASGAAHNDTARFANDGSIVTVLSVPVAVTGSTQFRSRASGNWNVSSTWEASADGTAWSPIITGFIPGSTPGATHQVYIQSGHTVTLTEAESCNNLEIAVGTSSSSDGSSGAGQVACATYALSVNGFVRGYYAAVGTVPGTYQPTAANFVPIIKSGTGGELKFVGNSRNVTETGKWGTYKTSQSPPLTDWEFALTSGQTATCQTQFKAANLTVSSGILDMGNNIPLMNGGVGGDGQGNLTISSGATMMSSSPTDFIRNTTLANASATVTVAGTLKLSGSTPTIAAVTLNFAGGTIEYAGSSQTLLAERATGTATDPNAAPYNNITLSGTGTKTLSGNITVNGTLTVGSGTTLDFNSLTVTTPNPPSLGGSLKMEVAKASGTFTGSRLTQSAGTLTYSGTLTVAETGDALALGDSIPLFTSAGGFGGSFSSITILPQLGLTGTVSGGNLTIACDGTLAASAGAPPATVCAGTPVQIGGSPTASGGSGPGTYTYSWNPGGTAVANPTVSPTTTTLYTVTVTDANGCTAQSQVNVTVNAGPTASAISGSSSVAIGQMGVAYAVTPANGGSTYAWSVPSGAAIIGPTTGPSITVNLGSTGGNLTVTETTSLGCTGAQVPLTVTMTANHAPVAPPNRDLHTAKNTAATITTTKLLAGATDPDTGDALSVSAAGPTSQQGGTVVLEAADVKYTPPTGFTGSDSFTFTISDGNGGTAVGTVTVTVTSNNGESPNVVSGPSYDSNTHTFRVTFAGIPNYTYTVQTATDPSGPWVFLNTATAGTNGLFEVTDTQASPDPARYYRTVYP